MKHNKSFTLIELLMVISIIGLISSVILVNLGGAKEKARIAKGLQFSQSVLNALGDQAVGIWDFNEGAGTTAGDSSGLNKNGTIVGASWTSQGDTPSGKGYALNLPGADTSYIEVADSPDFDPDQNGFTYEAWIKPTSFTNNLNIFMNHGPATYFCVRSTQTLCMTMYVGGSIKSVDGSSQLKLNQWHHVVATYDSIGMMRVYLDGKLDGQAGPYLGGFYNYNAFFFIGKGPSAGYGYTGFIDNVRVYKSGLSAGEIQKHYVEGLKWHMAERNQ